MEKLFLTVACGDYDRTKPLQDGSVEPEGIKLNYVALQSEEIFWRMGHYREFDASEMSLSNHITMLGRGDSPFVGIPIFPFAIFQALVRLLQRRFRHQKTGRLQRKESRHSGVCDDGGGVDSGIF